MSYQVFARKYRPKVFKDIVGQDHVVQTLRNAIVQDRLAHAYLFVGPRGTGKTSTARILAKALNAPNGPSVEFDPDAEIAQEIAEGRSLDVLEIDGASNNGVEQIRDLRDNVRFSPTKCTYKIYYIDEVHMLSTAAFNALLKTLEEPPKHVKFIFATTEPHKILPTIISRCQRFDLRPISMEVIMKQILFIAKNEGIEVTDSAAWAIAKGADGGMRDAQSMLDQLVAFCGDKIDEENVLEIFGFTSQEVVAKIILDLLNQNTVQLLESVMHQFSQGKDLAQLLGELITCIRNLIISKIDTQTKNEGIPEEYWNQLLDVIKPIPIEKILSLIDIFSDTEARMKWANDKKLHLEIGVIKAVQSLNEVRISDVIKTLSGKTFEPSAVVAAPIIEATAPVVLKEESSISEKKEETAVQEKQTEEIGLPKIIKSAPQKEEIKPTEINHFKKTKLSIDETFDSLIANAPEKPQVIEEEKKLDEAATENSVKSKKIEGKAEESDFYNDPLIQDALKIFDATIVT